jgi:hypothetical protein
MNSAELIIVGVAGLIILAISSYAYYKLHRRRIRQRQCFEALQCPCPICGAFSGSPCIDKHGEPIYLHWPRVATSFQSQPHTIR